MIIFVYKNKFLTKQHMRKLFDLLAIPLVAACAPKNPDSQYAKLVYLLFLSYFCTFFYSLIYV